MRTSDFDFNLPPDLIAQFPAANRRDSRLLALDGNSGRLEDRMFADLPAMVRPGDLLIFNDTRVIKARLHGTKASGGKIEVLIERILDEHQALAHVRASKTPKAGSTLLIEGIPVTVLSKQGDLYLLQFDTGLGISALLDRYGTLPLPPYIDHTAGNMDEERYQTVFARRPGAIAAPTAGLHFDTDMLEKLKAQGVSIGYITLHVGAGTFQPVRTEEIAEHKMHSELYTIPQETIELIAATRAQGGKVTAVGTTVLRALESAAGSAQLTAGTSETSIFITPGYRFKVIERLLTNFHLPRSTLLMLISAFGGIENIRHAYEHAVNQKYRFFSYGDAMLIERRISDNIIG